MISKFYCSTIAFESVAYVYVIIFRSFRVTQVEIDGCKFLLPLSISTFLSQIEESHFITCNYTRAKVFHSLYGSVMGDDATNFKISARKILSLVKQCLDHLGIRFWLSSGTCLGKIDLSLTLHDFILEILITN